MLRELRESKVDSFVDATQFLDQFVVRDVEVYRCSVIKDGNRVLSKSCTVTLAGIHCSSEIKA